MSTAVSSEKLSSKFQISVEKYKLKNGMRILLNPDNRVNTASYALGFAVGSRHERLGITGISHMFEHLMFSGTKKYPNFDEVYGSNGVVSDNAFTGKDYTAYHASFPPEKLELVLDVESDRMSHLTINQKIMDIEKGVVQEERLMRVDNRPRGLLIENLFELVFTKHSYRFPVVGYKEDIASYTLEDLRNWYSTYYSPNNAVLVISGNFSSKKAKKWIEKYFGPLTAKEIPKEIKLSEPESRTNRSRILNKKFKSSLTSLAYLIPPQGSEEFYALDFMDHILGSGKSSLLYKKLVREQSLLSSIHTSALGFLDYGLFLISYSSLDFSKEERIKELILEELKKGIEYGLSNQSLEKVKNIQLNNILDSFKGSKSRALLILDYEIQFGDYKKIYEELDWFNKISPEFVQKTAKKYLKPENMYYMSIKAEEKNKR